MSVLIFLYSIYLIEFAYFAASLYILKHARSLLSKLAQISEQASKLFICAIVFLVSRAFQWTIYFAIDVQPLSRHWLYSAVLRRYVQSKHILQNFFTTTMPLAKFVRRSQRMYAIPSSVQHPIFMRFWNLLGFTKKVRDFSAASASPLVFDWLTTFLVACYATLHPLCPSVSRSVHRSVYQTLLFVIF